MATEGHVSQFLYNTKDVSPYVTNVSFERSMDQSDTTTFGQTAHTFIGGLMNGKITVTGLWDKTSLVGSFTVFSALLEQSATSAFVWGPEGPTAGNVKYTGNATVMTYTEASPVADLVTFVAVLQVSGATTRTVY